MSGAATLVESLTWYGWLGAAVSLVFLGFGIDRVDASARGSYPFRVLLVPGVVLLWPLVLWRWLALERSGEDMPAWRHRHSPRRRLHARVALVLAIVLPLILVTSFVAQQMVPDPVPAERLGSP